MRYETNVHPEPAGLCDLRESVGYGRAEEDYPGAFASYTTSIAAYDGDLLVGWCALVGDRVRHAFLVDVIVRPSHQRRGIGQEIVRRAVIEERARGVTIVHADFARPNEAFYRSCGFEIGVAGTLEFREYYGRT